MVDTKDILSSYVTNVTKKSSGRPSKYSEEFKLLLLNSQHMYAKDIYEKVQRCFPQYDITLAGLKAYMYNHNITFKKAEIPVKNTNVKEIQNLNNTDARRKYSLEYINRLRQLSSCTAREMYEIAIKEFPQYTFNNRDWAKFLYAYNIDYKRIKGLKGVTKHKKVDSNNVKQNELVKEQQTQDKVKDEVNNLTKINNSLETHIEPVTTEELKIQQKQNDNRLQNIELEVNKVVELKAKELNCYIEKHFTTEELIKILKDLSYLSKYIDNLLKCVVDQYDIMNAYQDDILHEFEFAEIDDNNTYLQDKLNIFRNKRREIDTYKDDLTILKPFLHTVNNQSLESIIAQLETHKFELSRAKYIPKVDTGLYDRYEWVFNKEDVHENNKGTAYKILRSNRIEDNKESNVGLPPTVTVNTNNFKVVCTIYGGKFGTGKTWSREYKCRDSYTAIKWAKQELNSIIDPNKGVFYKQLEVGNM